MNYLVPTSITWLKKKTELGTKAIYVRLEEVWSIFDNLEFGKRVDTPEFD